MMAKPHDLFFSFSSENNTQVRPMFQDHQKAQPDLWVLRTMQIGMETNTNSPPPLPFLSFPSRLLTSAQQQTNKKQHDRISMPKTHHLIRPSRAVQILIESRLTNPPAPVILWRFWIPILAPELDIWRPTGRSFIFNSLKISSVLSQFFCSSFSIRSSTQQQRKSKP
jgi:hypothetical protein